MKKPIDNVKSKRESRPRLTRHLYSSLGVGLVTALTLGACGPKVPAGLGE